MTSMDEIQRSVPQRPHVGEMYLDESEKKLRRYIVGERGQYRWADAFQVPALPTDEGADRTIAWLNDHGAARISFTSALQPPGAQAAVLFQNILGTHTEMAFSGDILVDHEGIVGVRVVRDKI